MVSSIVRFGLFDSKRRRRSHGGGLVSWNAGTEGGMSLVDVVVTETKFNNQLMNCSDSFVLFDG